MRSKNLFHIGIDDHYLTILIMLPWIMFVIILLCQLKYWWSISNMAEFDLGKKVIYLLIWEICAFILVSSVLQSDLLKWILYCLLRMCFFIIYLQVNCIYYRIFFSQKLSYFSLHSLYCSNTIDIVFFHVNFEELAYQRENFQSRSI